METSSFNAPATFIQEGDVGPLPRADATTLGAYLGNADLTALGDAAAAALAAAGEMSPSGRPSMHPVLAGSGLTFWECVAVLHSPMVMAGGRGSLHRCVVQIKPVPQAGVWLTCWCVLCAVCCVLCRHGWCCIR